MLLKCKPCRVCDLKKKKKHLQVLNSLSRLHMAVISMKNNDDTSPPPTPSCNLCIGSRLLQSAHKVKAFRCSRESDVIAARAIHTSPSDAHLPPKYFGFHEYEWLRTMGEDLVYSHLMPCLLPPPTHPLRKKIK